DRKGTSDTEVPFLNGNLYETGSAAAAGGAVRPGPSASGRRRRTAADPATRGGLSPGSDRPGSLPGCRRIPTVSAGTRRTARAASIKVSVDMLEPRRSILVRRRATVTQAGRLLSDDHVQEDGLSRRRGIPDHARRFGESSRSGQPAFVAVVQFQDGVAGT